MSNSVPTTIRYGRAPTVDLELANKAYVDSGDERIMTSKGDLISFNTIVARLGIGANASVLTANSSLGMGLGWAVIPTTAFSDLTGVIALTQISNLLITLNKLNQDGATDEQVMAWSDSSGKWIPSTAGGGSLGDLEFIQTKVLSSDYFQVSGSINAVTNTIEYVVPNNKTAFMITAKIVATGHTVPAVPSNTENTTTTVTNMTEAQFLVDTVVKDTTNIGFNSSVHAGEGSASAKWGGGTGYGNIGDGKFNVKGLSLIGDGSKKIEIKNSLDGGSSFATMSGYTIDT